MCVGTLSVGVCMLMYSVCVCAHIIVSFSLQHLFQRESDWFCFCSREFSLRKYGMQEHKSLGNSLFLIMSSEYINIHRSGFYSVVQKQV